MGCIGQVGPDAYNARRVAVAAGVPGRRTGVHGQPAVRLGAAGDLVRGDGDAVERLGPRAGGWRRVDEPDALLRLRRERGFRLGDRALVDGTVLMLTDPFHRRPHGRHRRAGRGEVRRLPAGAGRVRTRVPAQGECRCRAAAFAEEIVPVEVAGRGARVVSADEHPKPETTVEILAALRPAFDPAAPSRPATRQASTTAAPPLVLASESAAATAGSPGWSSLEASTTAAMEPELMGYAPGPRAADASSRGPASAPRTSTSIELNEAFASQAVAVIRDAGLDPERVNPYGGAIALGTRWVPPARS